MEEELKQEQEFTLEDFVRICKRLWSKRKFLIYVVGAFIVLGLAAALMQHPVYTASCVFVPQSSSSTKSSSISSLAALAGINLGDMSSGSSLSPLIYPKLLESVDFNKELLQSKISFKDSDGPVSILDYYTNPKYRKFSVGKVFGLVKKYTIGLPGVIIGAIKGKPEDVSAPAVGGREAIHTLTQDEYKVLKELKKHISLTVEKKEGYLTLSCSMGEAVASAQLCQAVFDLLGKYVADFQLRQAKATNSYIAERYQESKADYEASQMALAQFTDANRGTMTATAQTRREQLSADYELALAMYTEMSKQMLQSDMKVKEDTPKLSAVEPVTVPLKKSNSRSKVLIMWAFFGCVLAVGSVLLYDWLVDKGVDVDRFPFVKTIKSKF